MTFENKNLRCNHCRFWWPTAEATGNEPSRQRSILGQCRRRAPLPGTVDLPDHARHYPAWVTTKRATTGAASMNIPRRADAGTEQLKKTA